MDEFLKTEYEQCLSLIKYYDERHQALVKYASGLSGAVPSLLLAIFQLGGSAERHFWQFTFIIAVAVTFGLFAIFVVLTQMRLYFVYPVRQVNAIRRYSLAQLNDATFENQMYLSTSFSAFKWLSSHTLLSLLVSMQVGTFAALAVYAAILLEGCLRHSVYISVGAGCICSLILFAASAVYLSQNSSSHPDKSIHNEQVKQ